MPSRPYQISVEVAEQPDGTAAQGGIREWARQRRQALHATFPDEERGPFACEFYLLAWNRADADSLAAEVRGVEDVVAAYVKAPASLAVQPG
jgi:hypothetical protein